MIRFLQTPGKKKYVLGGLLLMICAAMVITLIPGGFLGEDANAAARAGVLAQIDDESVTYNEAVATARRMLRQRFGPQQTLPETYVRLMVPQTAEQLIDEKIMLVEAHRMGLSVSTDELKRALLREPEVAPEGKYIGDANYEALVRNAYDMSVADFERLYREQMLIGKLRAIVAGSVAVSDGEIQQEFVQRNTKIKFDYAVLTLEDVQKQVQVNENDLRTFFDKNKARYENSLPERRQIQYVIADAAQLPSAKASEEDLKRAYNERQESFRTPERVNVRHILIKTPAPGADGKVDENAKKAARAKAEQLLAQVRGGANFAELAKKNSEDLGSAKEGGSLGWVERERTVPEFEKAAFALEKGKISDIVESSFGFHIIKSEDKQPARVRPLDEVRAELEPLVAREKAASEADRLATTLESAVRTGGIEAAGQRLGAQVNSTGWITRAEAPQDLAAAPEAVDLAFSLNDKDPAQVQRTQNGIAVVRVTGVQPPSTPTFEQARARIEQDFRTERGRQLLAERLKQMADRARAQHDLRAAAKEVGATVKTSDLVTTQQQVADLGSMNTEAMSGLFGLNQGAIAGPLPTTGGGAVVAILEKQQPNSADMAGQRERLREELMGRKRSIAVELFRDTLRKRMEKEGKVKVFKDEMERLAPAPKAG